MRHKLTVAVLLTVTSLAQAKEASPAATPLAATDQISYIRALGRLNVNTASRAQLELVPGLDSSKIDALLRVRSEAPISDLAGLALPDDVADHLKIDGDSNFYRVRQNPLRRVSPVSPDGTQQAAAGVR